jgi:hypothetical protein
VSPGLDFETRLFAKVNAADLLRQELARPGYVPENIAIGVNTDAYQPCERERRITREVLEVLGECRHPYGLITKSALIERDIDLIAPMAEQGLACAAITLTTLDGEISRTLEPGGGAAPPPPPPATPPATGLSGNAELPGTVRAERFLAKRFMCPLKSYRTMFYPETPAGKANNTGAWSKRSIRRSVKDSVLKLDALSKRITLDYLNVRFLRFSNEKPQFIVVFELQSVHTPLVVVLQTPFQALI